MGKKAADSVSRFRVGNRLTDDNDRIEAREGHRESAYSASDEDEEGSGKGYAGWSLDLGVERPFCGLMGSWDGSKSKVTNNVTTTTTRTTDPLNLSEAGSYRGPGYDLQNNRVTALVDNVDASVYDHKKAQLSRSPLPAPHYPPSDRIDTSSYCCARIGTVSQMSPLTLTDRPCMGRMIISAVVADQTWKRRPGSFPSFLQ